MSEFVNYKQEIYTPFKSLQEAIRDLISSEGQLQNLHSLGSPKVYREFTDHKQEEVRAEAMGSSHRLEPTQSVDLL